MLWGKFSLRGDEHEEVRAWEDFIAPLASRGNACIVGKLLAECVVSKDIIKTPLLRAWKPSGCITFKNMGINMFLIEFKNTWDKSRVLEGRPWMFERCLVSLAYFDKTTPPAELDFDKATFWVRMFNLPLICMGRETGYQIGSMVGEVIEVDVDEDRVGWGEFLRVRIVLDLSKPFARGRIFRLRDKTIWVAF
jgi:hypothetical protein